MNATIQILINDEHIIIAQQVGGPGVTPIDPENVTNQTLQGYPTEDKNMSTGLEENEEIKFNSLFIV